MIRRMGFVANSSSSSFLIYGIYLKEEKLKKLVEKSAHPYIVEQREKWGVDDAVEILCEINGLFASVGDPNAWEDGLYIGASWDSVKDDETGAEFKARVQDLIESYLGKIKGYSTMEDAWYNG